MRSKEGYYLEKANGTRKIEEETIDDGNLSDTQLNSSICLGFLISFTIPICAS